MKVLTTPWRKPVADCGGISSLIAADYRLKHHDTEYNCDVIVHAYREVGSSLEAAVEVTHWSLGWVNNRPKKLAHSIKFENIVI